MPPVPKLVSAERGAGLRPSAPEHWDERDQND